MKTIKSETINIKDIKDDGLKTYFQEVRNKAAFRDKRGTLTSRSLTREEEVELFKEYELTKSEDIRNRIVNHNLRFVIMIAKNYNFSKFYTLKDLISCGNIGLLRAIENFDYKKGFKFITYASWWIRLEIMQSISDDSKLIRHNPTFHTFNKRFLSEKDKFFSLNGYEATNDQIIESLCENKKIKFKNTQKDIDLLCKVVQTIDDNTFISLSSTFNDDESETYENNIIMEDESENQDRNMMISNIKLDNLTKMEKIIIYYKFGLNEYPELSTKQISENMSISEDNVKLYIKKALKKIKNDL